MSTSLTLLPLYQGGDFSLEVLDFQVSTHDWDRIEQKYWKKLEKKIDSHLWRDPAWVYDDSCFWPMDSEDINTVDAIYIKDLYEKAGTYRERAAIAYIRELPSDIKVAFYWH